MMVDKNQSTELIHGSKKDDLPYMPFFVGDWLKAPDIQCLSYELKGLWFEMLCYMWESKERGVMIKANGAPYTVAELSRLLRLEEKLLKQNLKQLSDFDIYSKRESDGAIYSRRMAKDQRIREIRKKAGSQGGKKSFASRVAKAKIQANSENEYENESVNVINHRGNGKGDAPTLKEVEQYFEDAGYDKKLGRVFFGYYGAQGWTTGGEHPRKINSWEAKAFETINSPKKIKWLMGLEDESNKGNKPRGTIDFAKHEQELKIARGEMPDMVSNRVHKQLE